MTLSFIACDNDTETTLEGTTITTSITTSITTPISEAITEIQQPGEETWLMVEKANGLSGYVNRNGEVMIPFRYSSVEFFYQGVAIVHVDDNAGLIDANGEYILEPIYSRITMINSDYISSNDSNGHARLHNYEGTVINDMEDVIEYRYLDYEDYFVVKKNYLNYFAIYSLSTGFVTEYDYRAILPYSEGCFRVVENNNYTFKHKYIDTSGNTILDNDYTDATSFENGVSSVLVGDNYHLINISGDYVFDLASEIPFDFNEYGISLYQKDENIGLCNRLGNVVVNAIYSLKYSFGNIRMDMDTIYVDSTNGDQVIFDETGGILYRTSDYDITTSEGDFILLRSMSDEEVRVVDFDDNIILSTYTERVLFRTDFSGRLYIIVSESYTTNSEMYSIYDDSGNLVISGIPSNFQPTLDYSNQVIIIEDLYDFGGNLIAELPGDDSFLFGDLIIVKDDGLMGLYDIQGNELLPIVYENIYSLELLVYIFS